VCGRNKGEREGGREGTNEEEGLKFRRREEGREGGGTEGEKLRCKLRLRKL